MGSTWCSRALLKAAFSMWLEKRRCVWDRKKIGGDQWKKILLYFQLLLSLIHLVFKQASTSHKKKICSSVVSLSIPIHLCSQIIREVSGEGTTLSRPGEASQLSTSYNKKQFKVYRVSYPLWVHCYLKGTEDIIFSEYYMIKGSQISVGSEKSEKTLHR